MAHQFPVCNDSRPCFAKTERKTCKCLHHTGFADGACSFCKPHADVTNGVVYPFDDLYGRGYKKLKIF